MRSAYCLTALLLVVGSAVSPAGAQDSESALAIEQEVQRVARERVLWPQFDPLSIPLAVYTGERTYLFRHPSPPDGFYELETARRGAFVFHGRFPGVTANSSAEIGGVLTATLLVDGTHTGQGAKELAAIALHEAFHVYQRAHHPRWSANEGDLFLYPLDDARLLALRRLESAALRYALQSADLSVASCWARHALKYRGERFEAMDSAFATYERLSELNEGLASYVQLLAADQYMVEVPASGFPATAIRERAYVIGPAIAFLLDRLGSSWQSSLAADDQQYLDQLLQVTLEADSVHATATCAFEPDESARIESEAQRDAAAVTGARRTRREQFDARSGWRLVVEAAEGQLLWPQGFDPLNVERVDGGILHTRLLRLGNDAGELQVIDEAGADLETLTEGGGPHPLFNGIRRATVAGLARPEIVTEGRQVTVRAPGLSVQFSDASVHLTGTEVRIALPSRD